MDFVLLRLVLAPVYWCTSYTWLVWYLTLPRYKSYSWPQLGFTLRFFDAFGISLVPRWYWYIGASDGFVHHAPVLGQWPMQWFGTPSLLHKVCFATLKVKSHIDVKGFSFTFLNLLKQTLCFCHTIQKHNFCRKSAQLGHFCLEIFLIMCSSIAFEDLSLHR